MLLNLHFRVHEPFTNHIPFANMLKVWFLTRETNFCDE